MNAGPLPLILLCVAAGLAFAGRRSNWLGFGALILSAIAGAALPLARSLADGAIIGLWVSAIVTAALCFRPSWCADRILILTGLNAGAWTGGYAAITDQRAALLVALPIGLALMLGGWLISASYPIVVKVAASWTIAIASLSLLVSLLPTPGYAPDHMQ